MCVLMWRTQWKQLVLGILAECYLCSSCRRLLSSALSPLLSLQAERVFKEMLSMQAALVCVCSLSSQNTNLSSVQDPESGSNSRPELCPPSMACPKTEKNQWCWSMVPALRFIANYLPCPLPQVCLLSFMNMHLKMTFVTLPKKVFLIGWTGQSGGRCGQSSQALEEKDLRGSRQVQRRRKKEDCRGIGKIHVGPKEEK